MTPTLIVPGPAEDWLPTAIVASPFIANVHEPKLSWLPVTTLPEVIEHHAGHQRAVPELGIKQSVIESPRPLRAGDTVDLATWGLTNSEPPEYLPGVPFATAEVAEVRQVVDDGYDVSSDELIVCRYDGKQALINRQRHPGDWSSAQYGIRIENVELL